MVEEVILGRPILKRLRVIPAGFPNTISRISVFSEFIDQMEREFPDTISDKLPKTPMTGDPMVIHLKNDAAITPTRRLTARQIPLARQSAAQEVVEKLIRDK
ncbi:Hypothetical predicted protein, partial [Paramuricea clavata]